MKLLHPIEAVIAEFDINRISTERKRILQPLVEYIQKKVATQEPIRLNFICTHNSRRSHLSQIWAQTMAHYCGVPNVTCYSAGTEATALFPVIAQTIEEQGFQVHQLSSEANTVYAIKYAENELPIVCFSKTLEHSFNPKGQFGAVMTCDSANEACPIVVGAEKRMPITYKDPKVSDGTPLQQQVYNERSIQIGTEMLYVFKTVKKNNNR